MTETSQVVCDACGNDLTYTGNSEDYYLVLSSASKLPWYLREGERGGFVTDMAIAPPMAKTGHFCGHKCLEDWIERRRQERDAKAAERAGRSS